MSAKALKAGRGFTLIEIVIFIVIVGIAAVALLMTFGQTMPRSPLPAQLTVAGQLAQERMELILGRRSVVGFAGLSDPCAGAPAPPPLTICNNTYGYTVAVQGVSSAVLWNGNPAADFRLITVTVSLNGVQLAQSDAVWANY